MNEKLLTLNNGVYILEIRTDNPFKVKITKFSDFLFPKGYYYYTGSAQKNLIQRLRRHCKKSKKKYWHIDYVTNISTNHIKSIYIFEGAVKRKETELAQLLPEKLKCEILVKKFGNSDTRNTITHLFYKTKRIPYNQLFSLYQPIVRLTPSSIEIS
ncbi:DUF123 domain-containing protein [Bacteroidota bacterium]